MLRDHSPSAISWIGTVQAALTLIVGVAAGPLFDRGYFFAVLITASIGLVFSFMMLSLATQYWHVMLCQGLLAGICTGMLYIPSIAQIPQYFSTKFGTALGLVLSGASIGGIVYPYLFKKLLPSVGFGWACRSMGFLALGLLAISVVLVKPLRLPNPPKKIFDRSLFKNVFYTSFILGAFFQFVGIMIPYFDAATFWWAKFDHDIDSAFYTLLIVNAGNFFGRIGLTAITDYAIAYQVGAEGLIVLSSLACVILGFCWISISSHASYYAFLVLWGFFSGGAASLPAIMMRSIVTRRDVFATSLGIIYGAAGVGVLIGAPIANSGGSTNFLPAQLCTGIASFLGMICGVITAVGARRNRMAAK
ncbi:hypothetical protein ANO11243_053000 [Dothideomycetidae sp. 11243]|nr:hypothetical protein ANO11243_053000 [fungal sp. No.11243]